MKKYTYLILFTLFTLSLNAQDSEITSQWKLIKFGVSFGTEMDMIKNLDHGYMFQTAKDAEGSAFSDYNFQKEDFIGGVCENPNLRLLATLAVPKMKNVELTLALNMMFNKYDGVYYSNYNFNNDLPYEHLSFSSISDEIGLEAMLDKRMPFGKCFNFYFGGGFNVGYSFGGEMTIDGSSNRSTNKNMDREISDIVNGYYDYDTRLEYHEARDAFHNRLLMHLGISTRLFKRFEFGIDYRGGLGYRAIFGTQTKGTQLHASGATLRWII